MKLNNYILAAFIFLIPSSVFSGGFQIQNTDTLSQQNDFAVNQISAYYDQRQRKTYLQISNISPNNIRIHIQIFQHDKACDELDFFDELTPNDTVVYDLENIVRNNDSAVPVNLGDDSYGYVVVSDTTLDDGNNSNNISSLIGNFRIVDEAGYEYRTNMPSANPFFQTTELENRSNFIAAFNTIIDAKFADVVGYAFESGDVGMRTATVTNIEEGFSFDIFQLDLSEEPLSCDRRNFACGNVMNYGINEDYQNSKGGPLLCPGGGLADPDGGYINFRNGANLDFDGNNPDVGESDVFVNFIGLNNGDGTGSMDSWIQTAPSFITCSDNRLKKDIKYIQTLENGLKLYSFKYKQGISNSDNTYIGIMAQDLNGLGLGDAVVTMPNGYYGVNYSKLGLRMATWDEWNKKGLESIVIDNNN